MKSESAKLFQVKAKVKGKGQAQRINPSIEEPFLTK
jgi:hypothetical protein